MPVSSYLNTRPVLGERVYLHDTAQVIGDVQIGDDCSIWCNSVLRGDVNRIVIGEGSNIQDFSMGHVSHKNAAKPDGFSFDHRQVRDHRPLRDLARLHHRRRMPDRHGQHRHG